MINEKWETGFFVLVGRNKAGSFEYVKTIKEAKDFISQSIDFDLGRGLKDFDITIKSMLIKKCGINCNKLIPIEENYCLRCEDLRYDAMVETKERANEVDNVEDE